ncbi:MAG TPA: hypothetical protein VGK17_01560 [Propionicimonas sp.]|jgi:hypothetical protein
MTVLVFDRYGKLTNPGRFGDVPARPWGAPHGERDLEAAAGPDMASRFCSVMAGDLVERKKRGPYIPRTRRAPPGARTPDGGSTLADPAAPVEAGEIEPVRPSGSEDLYENIVNHAARASEA